MVLNGEGGGKNPIMVLKAEGRGKESNNGPEGRGEGGKNPIMVLKAEGRGQESNNGPEGRGEGERIQ